MSDPKSNDFERIARENREKAEKLKRERQEVNKRIIKSIRKGKPD